VISPPVVTRCLFTPWRIPWRGVAPRRNAGAFGLERLPRIAMVATRPPIAIASEARALKIGLRLFRRRPQPASREPLHFGVGMLLADTVEGRQ
jgi:hypothetical protein